MTRCAEAQVDIPPRARAAMFGEMKAGGVKALGDIARLVDPQEEERDALRAVALEGCRPVAGLLKRDAKESGEVVEVIEVFVRRAEEVFVGHQHRGGEVIGKFDPAARLSARFADFRPLDHRVNRIAILHQAQNMRELKDPVWIIECV